MKAFLALLGMFALPVATAAVPAPPGTDIWLVELTDSPGLSAGQPVNFTARPGYDNQPAFTTSGAFLFTSDANGQTDAWRFNLEGDAQPILVTPQSEYSPTPAPDGSITVVRVALDGVQQLWRLAAGSEDYELLFPMLEGIGYHAWIDDNRVALFMVRDPSELHIANRKTGEVAVMARDIGRSLQAVPGKPGTLAFVEAGQDGKRWIKQLDVDARRITPLAPVLGGSEDFAILPDGRLLMASGRTLHAWNGNAWQPIASFDALPGTITRLAISPDARRLAMVVTERE